MMHNLQRMKTIMLTGSSSSSSPSSNASSSSSYTSASSSSVTACTVRRYYNELLQSLPDFCSTKSIFYFMDGFIHVSAMELVWKDLKLLHYIREGFIIQTT